MRTNIINSMRTSEQPDSSDMGNPNELDDSNKEMATNYAHSRELYNRKTTVVDINFFSKIATVIDEDPEPQSMAECQKRSDWVKWKEAIEMELRSLKKNKCLDLLPARLPMFPPVGYKWLFVPKRNKNNVVVRYKTRLVAQGFTQRPGIDYDETYSPVMSGITF